MKSQEMTQKIDVLLNRFSLKKTPMRRNILTQFLKSKNSFTQGDLLTALAKSGVAADRISVYRNLNQMKTSGLIHEIDANQYIACTHECEQHPHLLLFCIGCAQHQEISNHNQMKHFMAALKPFHFFGTTAPLSLKGLCEACSQKS